MCVAVDGGIVQDRLVLIVLGVAFRGFNWTVRGGLHRSVPRASLRVWGK